MVKTPNLEGMVIGLRSKRSDVEQANHLPDTWKPRAPPNSPLASLGMTDYQEHDPLGTSKAWHKHVIPTCYYLLGDTMGSTQSRPRETPPFPVRRLIFSTRCL